MGTVARLYRADEWRVSRLHDMRGNRVAWSEIAALPALCWDAAVRELFGRRPELPWIPSAARAAIAALLTPQSKVLEFGSGMSSLWLARRSAAVRAVEHDQPWAEQVDRLARSRGLTNLTVDFAVDETQYVNPTDCNPESFDLVIVDGIARPECARASLRLVKPNGAIYLDNTDFGSQWQWYLDTETTLLHAAQERNGTVRYFTGFPPATFVACQSMLITFDPRPA
jgi:predicted O-methyltransferase YrrM